MAANMRNSRRISIGFSPTFTLQSKRGVSNFQPITGVNINIHHNVMFRNHIWLKWIVSMQQRLKYIGVWTDRENWISIIPDGYLITLDNFPNSFTGIKGNSQNTLFPTATVTLVRV